MWLKHRTVKETAFHIVRIFDIQIQMYYNDMRTRLQIKKDTYVVTFLTLQYLSREVSTSQPGGEGRGGEAAPVISSF
jgi:hypothetical protein